MGLKRPWTAPRDLDARDYELMRLPAIHHDTHVDSISDIGDPSPRQVVRRYLEHLREMRKRGHGLLLYGPNDTGKSAIAAHLLKAFRAHGQPGLFVRAEELRQSWFGDVDLPDGRDMWSRAQTVEVLVVDDLGKEHAGESGFVEHEFEYLIRQRYGASLPTIYTTNFTRKGMEDVYKDSTLNVLSSTATAVRVEVEGEGFRKQASRDLHDTLLEGA